MVVRDNSNSRQLEVKWFDIQNQLRQAAVKDIYFFKYTNKLVFKISRMPPKFCDMQYKVGHLD